MLDLQRERDSDNPIDKIVLYVKDLNEIKYQLLIKARADARIKQLNDPKAFIEYSAYIGDVYNNINDYNPNRKKKLCLMMLFSDIKNDKTFKAIIKEPLIRCRSLN